MKSKNRLSKTEKDYVFKDRATCNIVTRNEHGEGNFCTETLYQAFKQRLEEEWGDVEKQMV